MRLRPGRRLLWLAGLGAAAALAAPLAPGLPWLVALYDLLLAALLVGEAAWLRRRARELHLTRAVPPHALQGQPWSLTLQAENRGHRRLACELRLDLAVGAEASAPPAPAPRHLRLPAGGRALERVELCWPSRGAATIGALWVTLRGPAGLAELVWALPGHDELRVHPAVALGLRQQIRHLLAPRAEDGRLRRRIPGGGQELDRLREYVVGDPYRAIDWKATARRGPIVRELQPERNQLVLLCLDHSRVMRGGLLDGAIQATLLTAHTALRGGDLVGALIYSDQLDHYLPPAKGLAQYRRLLALLTPLAARPVSAEPRALAAALLARVRRRALVMVFSGLADDAHSDHLAATLAPLVRRHRLAYLTCQDPALAARARQTKPYERLAAQDLLAQQQRALLHLRKRGVAVLETPPDEAALAAVGHYLALKAAGRW